MNFGTHFLSSANNIKEFNRLRKKNVKINTAFVTRTLSVNTSFIRIGSVVKVLWWILQTYNKGLDYMDLHLLVILNGNSIFYLR